MTRRTGALGIPVDHTALGIHSTSTDLQAWIPAGSALATLIRVTVAVLLALERRALLRRLSPESIGTHAEHTVIGHSAHGVLSTGSVTQTRVQALAIDARVVVRAVGINTTTRNTGAALAQLTRGTCTRIATRPTLSIGARLTTSTLRVRITGLGAEHAKLIALAVGIASLQRLLASSQGIALVSVLAAALDTVIDHGTLGTLTALSRDGARVLALVIDTGLVVGAGGIGSTSSLAHAVLANQSFATRRVRVADGTARTTDATFVGQTVLVTEKLEIVKTLN